MGFHSFLQARNLPFEGAMAKSWNLKIFKHIRAQVDEASMMLAQERGPCPDAADMGVMERWVGVLLEGRRRKGNSVRLKKWLISDCASLSVGLTLPLPA